MKKLLILLDIVQAIVFLSAFVILTNTLALAETKSTNMHVGASLKYDYKINTATQSTTLNNDKIVFKTVIKNRYIEYYY